jgi:hypothetical protein
MTAIAVSSPTLTQGAIHRTCDGDVSFIPILQVLEVKSVEDQRYRIVLSDGECFHQAMLATQLNGLVISGAIREFAIVSLAEFVTAFLNNEQRRIIIIIDIQKVFDPTRVIGYPSSVDVVSRFDITHQSAVHFQPISSLNPHQTNNWTI